ncbi:MAG: heterodisulfide reductase-related iron-sulfur binding cluster [Desulfobacteria bacterium]
MEFALFLGCNIPIRLKQYETASRAVLHKLGVRLVDVPEFNCCGYPLRNIDLKAFVLSSARNLALAERQGLNMVVLCKCGFGTVRMAQHLIKENASLREEINTILATEGLKYEGDIQVKHLLTVLFSDVGTAAIKERSPGLTRTSKLRLIMAVTPCAPAIFCSLMTLWPPPYLINWWK